MASKKFCDFCKKSEPEIQFGGENTLPREEDVAFHDSNGVPVALQVRVVIACEDKAPDVCDSCKERIISLGMDSLSTRRSQASRGMFIVGKAALSQVARAN